MTRVSTARIGRARHGPQGTDRALGERPRARRGCQPVGQATRAQAGERRLSRRQEDAIDGERRTTALGDPAREAPPGDNGGAMATTGNHRAKPFGGRGRRERRRTKRDPGERCRGAAARATPCVAGVPPISGTHRPQGQLLWRSYDGSRSRSLSSLQRPRRSSDRLTEQPLRERGVSVPSQDIRPQVC